MQLLPGIGPATARELLDHLSEAGWAFAALDGFRPPAATAAYWPELCSLLSGLRRGATPWPGQMALTRRWYQPHLERLYDNPVARTGDLDQFEQISSSYPNRGSFLYGIDPGPAGSHQRRGNPAPSRRGLPHSVDHPLGKGQEWDAVFVLNVIDGCIPSDMAVGSREQIEEERRLLYVAMTRAREHLHLVRPMRMFRGHQHRHGDGHVLAMRSRFIPDSILDLFERRAHGRAIEGSASAATSPVRVDVAARVRQMWD